MAKVVRWTPQATTRNTVSPFGQLFEELWRANQPANDAGHPVLRPAMDVIENDTEVVVRVNVPGLAADDLDVQVDGDLLTISGTLANDADQFTADSDDETQAPRAWYHHRERRYGEFKRTLRLSDLVDSENIHATIENGVLNLVLPKLPEAQPKQIKVKMA